MDSGILIHDSVLNTFSEMKLLSTKSGRKFLRLCISEDGKFIVEDLQFDIQQEKCDDDYLNFLKHLRSDTACVLIYDVSYETKNSLIKEDLVFVQWCPVNAPGKQKIQLTTTIRLLKEKLNGIKTSLQLNGLDDISRVILAEKLGPDVVKIEGVAV
ncbi:cofilin-2-like [Scyliorhinus canicula]|uniref:cofilin-2-like n=1 Tax=Scyliorhinus canicula TaxID=7830 RepID=UPI0018F738F6|nr:cofilin-2-like [Scyliorhinus canicula]